MATKTSIVPDIIWNWVIKTLATFEQTDASTLIGLVRMAPAISSELGKDAREAVSLRILESLFLQGDEAVVDADAGQNGKLSFDLSESCENVLKQILDETPEHSALEKEKWDVRSFLTHKRSSLPKCALEKLKEALLKSSHPLLASLKKRSKLVIPNASEDTSPVNDGNFDVQDTVTKDDSAVLNPEKDKGNFQKEVLQEGDQVGNVQQDQPQLHFNDESLPEDTDDERVSPNSMGNLEFVVNLKDNNVQPSASDGEPLSSDENSIEHDDQLERVTNIERIDGDQTDSFINHCVKCNSGGELLVCSSDACPLQLHERCLGLAVTLDEDGNFFCPFCVYSRAISKYRDAKRKTLQARNDLQAFSKKNRPIESFKKQSEFEKNEDRQTGAFAETTQGNVANQNMTEGERQVNVNESDLVTGRHVDKHTPQPSTLKRKCKEKESQRLTESSCSREPRKRKVQW